MLRRAIARRAGPLLARQHASGGYNWARKKRRAPANINSGLGEYG